MSRDTTVLFIIYARVKEDLKGKVMICITGEELNLNTFGIEPKNLASKCSILYKLCRRPTEQTSRSKKIKYLLFTAVSLMWSHGHVLSPLP